MTDLKLIIAKNISTLRKESEMTQFELAEKLNYSDKAVSKWERGESIPDVTILKQIADLFSVTVDYLLEEEHSQKKTLKDFYRRKKINRGFITGISIALVWLIALILFVIGDIFNEYIMGRQYLLFLFAVPVTFIVWLVMNSVWFNVRRNFLIISLLVWSCLATLHISLLVFGGFNFYKIYFLGIPAQIIIILWSRIKTRNSQR